MVRNRRREKIVVITGLILIALIFLAVIFFKSGEEGSTSHNPVGEISTGAVGEDSYVLELEALGYPSIVRDAMEPALKEQICRDQVRFYGATIGYWSEEVGRLKEFMYLKAKNNTQEFFTREDAPEEYDLCLILVMGVCYQGGELEHVLLSANYRWNGMPLDRYEDRFEISWDGETFWNVSYECPVSYSQIRKDGTREGLGYKWDTKNYEYGKAHWETNMTEAERWGLKGVAGSGWVQVRPNERLWQDKHYVNLRGGYEYIDERLAYTGRVFNVDLQVIMPPQKEDVQ